MIGAQEYILKPLDYDSTNYNVIKDYLKLWRARNPDVLFLFLISKPVQSTKYQVLFSFFIDQTGPLDLDTDDFYDTRKDLVESQLNKIQDGMAEEILITCWDLHYGEFCRGVNWDRHSLADLRAVVSCMRAQSLASICRHLALDYR